MFIWFQQSKTNTVILDLTHYIGGCGDQELTRRVLNTFDMKCPCPFKLKMLNTCLNYVNDFFKVVCNIQHLLPGSWPVNLILPLRKQHSC